MAATGVDISNGQHDMNRESSEFELRRATLIGEIGDSLETVLTQINALNRSLEGIIEIGNEFASVEALWSQFENVMGKNNDEVVEESRINSDKAVSEERDKTAQQ